MKNIFKLLQLSTILAVGVSCSDVMVDELADETMAQNGDYATITIGVPQTRVSYLYDSNSGITTAWESGDEITITKCNDSEVTSLFTLSEITEDLSATFIAQDATFAFDQGEEYKITYAPTSDEALTQSASGDSSHLKYGVTMSTVFTYGNVAITLVSEQCVEAVTLSSFAGMTPTAVKVACGENSTTVELGYTPLSEAVVLIPIDPITSGSEVTFTVTYKDENGVETTMDKTATPTKDHIAGCVYTSNFVMIVSSAIDITESNATSASNTITLPFGAAISETGEVSDYRVSVSNNNYDGDQNITVTKISASGTNLILTLSDTIYSDDNVTVSYSGDSATCNDGGTAVNNFLGLSVTISVSDLDLVNSSASNLYTFDRSDNNTYSNHKAFILATEGDNNNNVMYYSYDNSYANSTQGTSGATAACYIGINEDPQPIPFTVGDYIVRFDCMMLEATSSLTRAFYARIKTPSSQIIEPIDFGTYTLNEWYSIDVEMPLTTTLGYTDGEEASSHISFRTVATSTETNDSSKYVTPVDAEFYIDNVKVYKKSDIFRTAKAQNIVSEDSSFSIESMGEGADGGKF